MGLTASIPAALFSLTASIPAAQFSLTASIPAAQFLLQYESAFDISVAGSGGVETIFKDQKSFDSRHSYPERDLVLQVI